MSDSDSDDIYRKTETVLDAEALMKSIDRGEDSEGAVTYYYKGVPFFWASAVEEASIRSD